ncbi:MAG TPA: DUF3391 domain-containing protein, partial [Ramlibacter sp.]|nr:DUF3391 domain-containing protein [Ramlibacter sp.]
MDELQVGMFVQHIEGGWLNHPFWRGSFLIREFDDIRRLRAAGVEYVEIDSSKGLGAPRPVHAPARPADAPYEPAPVLSRRRAAISMEDEVQRAQAFRLEAGRQMKVLFQQARMGRSVDVGSVRPLVDDIFLSVERHPAALISLLRL